jgi:hypothetical protein
MPPGLLRCIPNPERPPRSFSSDMRSATTTASWRPEAMPLPGRLWTLWPIRDISPNLERNRDTMKPLADRIGVEITLTPKISLPVVGEICREILTVHAGKVVLWVGNVSGTFRPSTGNSAAKGPALEYGQLFILTLSDKGPTQVDELSFDI